MTCLEAALMVLALGAALPAVAHTLLEVRRGLHRPRHWLTMWSRRSRDIDTYSGAPAGR